MLSITSCYFIFSTLLFIGGYAHKLTPSAILAEADDIIWSKLSHNPYQHETPKSRYHVSRTKNIPFLKSYLEFMGMSQDDLRDLRVIHIAGSKGKGSTSAFIERIMRTAGLRTALYTSPHLIHPRERLCINGMPMDEMEFAQAVVRLYRQIKQAKAPMPKFFHFLTLLALKHMVELQKEGALDVAIIEVGMGGRYDATNVVDYPAVTAITSLAMEHVKELGPTLGDIAQHKVGIAKEDVWCFSLPQLPEAMEVVMEECRKIGAPLVFTSGRADYLEGVTLGIQGDHQKLNADLAIRVCQHWLQRHGLTRLSPEIIHKALKDTKWPGRHQIVTDKTQQITWYLDGAHTIESLQFVSQWFRRQADAEGEKVLLFHCTHGRSYEHLLKPLLEIDFDRVYFVKPSLPTDSEEERTNPDLTLHKAMADYWRRTKGGKATAMALRDLPSMIREGDQVLITGSLYLVGDSMRTLGIPFKLG